jgi:hypothetical protein
MGLTIIYSDNMTFYILTQSLNISKYITIVAYVRRLGDRPLSVCIWQIWGWGRQGILVFYPWKTGMGVSTLYFGH